MNARFFTICGLAVCAILGPSLATLPSGDGAATTPATAAVTLGSVDVEKVLREHPAVKKAFEEAAGRRSSSVESLKEKVAQARKTKESQDLFKRESPEWLELEKEYKILEATFKLDREVITAEYRLFMYEKMSKIYTDVQKLIADVAKTRGLSTVLNLSERPVGGGTHLSFLDRLTRREFVYVDKSLDITDEVLKRLPQK